MAKALELIKTKGYADARSMVDTWQKRLETAGKEEAVRINREKMVFFQDMKRNKPDLYRLFEIDNKILSETVMKKLTGRDVIID